MAGTLISSAPAICVFLKPRLSGTRYLKELPDRVVITWDLTEPFGGLLDFTWFRTINRFQVVLRSDGSIEMSYRELAAKDAIVGIYPMLAGKEKPLAVHLSSLTRQDGPFAAVYEAFHYLSPPKPQDLSCTIIKALGDKFDFLAYYSDFRIDTQEASSPGDGPVGGNVTGIGQTLHDQTRQVLRESLYPRQVPAWVPTAGVCGLQRDAGTTPRRSTRREQSRHNLLLPPARGGVIGRKAPSLQLRGRSLGA